MFIVTEYAALKEIICSQRERELSIKSSFLWYVQSRLPHKVASLECYYYYHALALLSNGTYTNISQVVMTYMIFGSVSAKHRAYRKHKSIHNLKVVNEGCVCVGGGGVGHSQISVLTLKTVHSMTFFGLELYLQCHTANPNPLASSKHCVKYE